MYKIADISFDLKFKTEHSKLHFDEYESDVCNNAEKIVISCTDEEIKAETTEGDFFSDAYLEFIAIHRRLAEEIHRFDAFVLHSVVLDVEGEGVAFAAHSGTGKSTHMMRWRRYLRDKATIVNGDKPIVRFIDGIPYAYGTPWRGKERWGCNMKTPLKHICFIERAETNYVEKVSKEDVIDRIFNQVYMPQNNPMGVVNTMQLIDRLLSCCDLWIIHCNMDDNAGEIAYKAIFNS